MSLRRRMLGAAAASVAIVACHRAPSPTESSAPMQRIPRDAPRFEIDSVTDSTAIFRPREAQWIRRGDIVFAVDPMQRDAVIAQLRVVVRDSVRAVALVTAQVSSVKPTHALLVVRQRPSWWRRGLFWSGAGIGAVVGAGAVALTR